ncbi:MAG TPA: hypothetical protein VJ755_09475 [Gemmatimonadales bacterium]|nr:hypothetical protein [Gemmatimonadales bacterium]
MSDDAPKDPLALGLGSLGGGAGFGSAFMTMSQIALRLLQDQFERIGYQILTAGVIAAVGVGGAYGWYRSFSLDSVWQRGVIAVLASVGALLIGFMAAPLDGFFGVAGMLVWLALNIAFGVAAARWAIKGMGKGEAGGGTGVR